MAVPGLVNAAAVASSDEGRCDVQFGQAEVQDLCLSALGNEDIGRLDVAMHDPARVRGVQGIRDLDRKIQQLIELDGRAFDAVLERLAVQELHGDEGLMVLLPDLINRADVGVIQRRGRLCFTPEAFQGLMVLGKAFGQEFQGDKSVESRVLGLVDHTHPTAAQLRDDAVMRDGLADHAKGSNKSANRRAAAGGKSTKSNRGDRAEIVVRQRYILARGHNLQR